MALALSRELFSRRIVMDLLERVDNASIILHYTLYYGIGHMKRLVVEMRADSFILVPLK